MKSSQIDHDNRLLGDGTGQTLTYTSGFRRELSRPSAEEEKGTATILSITQVAPPSDAKEFDVSSSHLDRPGRGRC
jgi:hypothetical protein